MCCKNFWLRIVSFALALVIGLLAVNILHKENLASKNEKNIKPLDKIVYSNAGSGFSGGSGISSGNRGNSLGTSIEDKAAKNVPSETKSVQIISKPRASYTDAARRNQLQGTVSLRVTFMASGEIGSVSTIAELPDGLTEQAVSAARAIKFEPAEINGIPQTVTKQVQYSFMLY